MEIPRTKGLVLMKTYKVTAVERVRSMGIYEAESKEEAIEMFRLDSNKVDYSQTPVGFLHSGWNPKAVVYDADV
jgi:hypothetical protein